MKFFVFLFGFLIYPFSFIIPRSKRKWTFGSFRNSFNDNSKYLFIYASRKFPDKNIVWISAGKKTVKSINDLGLKAYYIGSIKGLLHTLSSKYWFFNSYTSDILFFASGNAICVNLWHGVGLKKIEFSIKTGKLADRFVRKTLKERFYHPESFRRPDYLLSSTDFQSVKFAEAFRIKLSQCLNIGYPRNTILMATEEERIRFISRYENPATLELMKQLKSYENVFIYMPTWRDSQEDVFSNNIDLSILNLIMQEKNHLLILKPHANTKVDIEKLSRYENVILLDNKIDIYTVLPYTNVLITDYSSVLYDYILMDNKDVILYLYDMKEYIHERDFNYPFMENVTGKIVYNFEEFVNCLKKDDYKIDEIRKEEIKQKFWGAGWNKTIAEVSEEIIDKTIKL